MTSPASRFHFHVYQFGMAVFLVSLTAFFGALMIAYGLRLRTAPGVAVHVPRTLWLSTLLIAASSAALEASRYCLRRGRLLRHGLWHRGTLWLGASFLLSQAISWADLAAQGVYARGSPAGSVFYAFTGIHGVHAAGGLIWLLWLLRRARTLHLGTETDLRKHRYITSAAALYWHFIGVLWWLLFALLLLWT
ncbi:MAG: cytochrome c oxidase subunit 3 [Acidobacteria bacterium]|nr:cytochrome c oxidase subunit 3 [Acidobacteriota bacterium]